jgi:hypothetical protein
MMAFLLHGYITRSELKVIAKSCAGLSAWMVREEQGLKTTEANSDLPEWSMDRLRRVRLFRRQMELKG